MANQYPDFQAPFSAAGRLDTNTRRPRPLYGFLRGRTTAANDPQEPQRTPERRHDTETDRQRAEQIRLEEERAFRRAQSEENRRRAAAFHDPAGGQMIYDAQAPVIRGNVADLAEGDIDIALPKPAPKQPEQPEQSGKTPADKPDPKQKKQAKKKAARQKKRAAAAARKKSRSEKKAELQQNGRYTGSSSQGNPGRITTSGAIAIGMLSVLLIGCVIYGKVQTNEVYTEIAALQAEYDDLTEKNASLKSEMEAKMTVKNIEEYAENVLGLQQLDRSQISYIQLQTEDEVTISEPEENLIVVINDYLKSLWELLRGN